MKSGARGAVADMHRQMRFPPRVERDTSAAVFDLLDHGGPVFFGEVAFSSTGGGPELKTRVKEEVMTKLGVAENSIKIQLLEGLPVNEGQ